MNVRFAHKRTLLDSRFLARSGHPCRPNRRSSLRLINIPEYWRGRTVEYTGERFPPRAGQEILPERDVNDLVIDFALDLACDLLLLFGRRRARERIAHRFHPGVFRPAEPAALRAFAADLQMADGIDHVGGGQIGEEHVPAALLRGFWLARRETTVCQSAACTSTLK